MVTKKEVLEYFGGLGATARALRIHENSVRRWPDVLVQSVVYKIELATNGHFKTDETLLKEKLQQECEGIQPAPCVEHDTTINKLLGIE